MTEPVSTPGAAPTGRWELTPRRQSAAAFLLLFLITIPMLTKIFTSDFGTHMAIGREIVQNRHIPTKELWNYPSLGMDNGSGGEWGFEAVLYMVYSAAGPYGVSFMIWAIVLGIFWLLYQATVLRGGNPLLTILAIFAFSGFLRIRIQPRPEIFTYLFIALTIYLLSEYYFGRRKRAIYLFPPLILAWANCHPTYLMAFGLCGAFFIDALARAAWNKEFRWDKLRGWLLPPVATGFAGLLLCGLNPHGYGWLLAPLHMISRGEGTASSNILLSISELTPVAGTGFYVYYKAAVAFALVSLCMGAIGRRLYLLDLLLFAIAFKGAWGSARAVSMMGLFLSPGASIQLTGFVEAAYGWFATPKLSEPRQAAKGKGKKRKSPEEPRRQISVPEPRPHMNWRQAATLAAVASVLALFGGTTLSFSMGQLEYGVGITEHKFSFKAAEFLRKNPVPGNMFNFFDIGGFLDWQLYPKALTFIDGRTYNHAVFADHQLVTGAAPGWDNVLRKYGVTYIVIKSMDSSGMILPIVPALANDPGWSLVFSDGIFLIFVRNIPELKDYNRLHQIPKGVIPQHIIREAYHYTFLGVSPIVAYQTMSNMYMVMGRRDLAIEALRKGLEESGENPYLRGRLLQLEQGGVPR
jgi:hypothetical protein